MLFQQLAELAKQGVRITLEVADAGDGRIEVNVHPVSETGKSGHGLVSKQFVATPAEFDAEFADIVAGFGATTLSLKQQLAAVEVVASAASNAASAAVASPAKRLPAPSRGTSAPAAQPQALAAPTAPAGGPQELVLDL